MSLADKDEQSRDSRQVVGMPRELGLSFFAYGIFRVNEIAWPRIRGFVSSHSSSEIAAWVIRLRNGLPVLVAHSEGVVHGDCVKFFDPESAYSIIGNSEPDGEYKWKTITTVSGERCNVLVAEKPGRGVSEEPISSWTSAQDPTFVHGMASVAAAVTEVRDLLLVNKPWSDSPEDWDAFFRLQGAFLVLWSIVERFAAFRFGAEYVPSGMGKNTTAKIYALAEVPEFRSAFVKARIKPLSLYSVRENRLKKTKKDKNYLDDEEIDPVNVLKTWYQVRSNITHRGKSAKSDNAMVLSATIDLFNVTYLYLETVVDGMDREWRRRDLFPLPQADEN